MSSPYRTRFAPSPTGKLHLGHARTSLVTWLRARKLAGQIVMRIEDIDRPRVVPGAADAICRDHEWLGLDWDEGPIFQSTRSEAYEAALDTLSHTGLVYPCTCSRKEIAKVASAPHGEQGPRYPGTCRNGPTKAERPAALRFRFDDPSPGFEDLLCGVYSGGKVGGDFVLRRFDGIWAYQLAVVVDDADMGITEVVRGADLLSSTSRQIALFRALRRPVPGFAHVGLVVDPDGVRLSKRHGATAIEALRDAGRSAEQVIGELACSLGITATAAPIQPEELVSRFALDKISRSSFVWDPRG
ncbi:MAG: tRNA glutamyl-Q(34) synthetase GluQRS [Myxococcales bacterium]|nr:tRNA glutamyl-Q(34) synthetase GluQRS [Myxococcales bacterium]MDH3485045.1 tRNA glutamyl-Q(34) synthetase GluQRS [Myxococcales bacterium]